MDRRALVLCNDGARAVAENVGPVLDILRGHGFDVVKPLIPSRASASQAVRDHKDDVDLVIAAGGDGTLNSVLQGVVGTELPLGILPLGTANDLTKTLNIPADLSAACEVIALGHTRRIDIGRVNGIYYFNEASLGLSVALCRQLTSQAKARFGVFAIAYQVISVMKRVRRFHALVSADGGKEFAVRSAQITIGNSRNFGGIVVSDDAAIDDRLLDLYSIGFPHWWSYFEALLSLLRRRYDDASTVYTMHGKRFEIRTARSLPIEADGEIVSHTPATFEIVPQSVSLFVPDPQPGPPG